VGLENLAVLWRIRDFVTMRYTNLLLPLPAKFETWLSKMLAKFQWGQSQI